MLRPFDLHTHSEDGEADSADRIANIILAIAYPVVMASVIGIIAIWFGVYAEQKPPRCATGSAAATFTNCRKI